MESSETPQRLSWTENALYRELTALFPELRTRQQNVLDVKVLADRIGFSHECVYKWLRKGRIPSPEGVSRIVGLASEPANAEALARTGRTPPTKEEFARFMLP